MSLPRCAARNHCIMTGLPFGRHDEYDGVSSRVTDAISLLRLAHSRHERNRVAKKQSKASTKASIFGSLLSY
eukprot:scaffold58_cov105-Skeletonema_dohrnii-CCMP3373.AAC.2